MKLPKSIFVEKGYHSLDSLCWAVFGAFYKEGIIS